MLQGTPQGFTAEEESRASKECGEQLQVQLEKDGKQQNKTELDVAKCSVLHFQREGIKL